jgi:hypothetical protein
MHMSHSTRMVTLFAKLALVSGFRALLLSSYDNAKQLAAPLCPNCTPYLPASTLGKKCDEVDDGDGVFLLNNQVGNAIRDCCSST